MKFETKLSKEQFIEAIKAAVRNLYPNEEVFEYHYRLTAAYHLANFAREQWDNDAYVSMFMGEPFEQLHTEADADSYFGRQYQQLVEEFEDYEEDEESDLIKGAVYTPEQFIEKLDLS